MIFTGSAVALITPFDKDNNVDYKAYDKILDFHLENNTDALVVCGTTGEAATMTEDERLELIKYTAKKIGDKLPIIAGTGSNNTKASADFSKKVSAIDGIDALLVVTPFYNKASKEGLYLHFKTIAACSSKPIILYTVPSRTNVDIDVETLVKLSKIDNIVAIKDASGDLSYTAKIRKCLPDEFAIYSGNDDLTLPMLALGIDGAISVFANVFPKENHDLIKLFKEGKVEEAKEIHLKYFDFIKNLFVEVNPIPVKAACNMIGLCENNIRLPLTRANENTLNIIKKNLEEFSLC